MMQRPSPNRPTKFWKCDLQKWIQNDSNISSEIRRKMRSNGSFTPSRSASSSFVQNVLKYISKSAKQEIYVGGGGLETHQNKDMEKSSFSIIWDVWHLSIPYRDTESSPKWANGVGSGIERGKKIWIWHHKTATAISILTLVRVKYYLHQKVPFLNTWIGMQYSVT